MVRTSKCHQVAGETLAETYTGIEGDKGETDKPKGRVCETKITEHPMGMKLREGKREETLHTKLKPRALLQGQALVKELEHRVTLSVGFFFFNNIEDSTKPHPHLFSFIFRKDLTKLPWLALNL